MWMSEWVSRWVSEWVKVHQVLVRKSCRGFWAPGMVNLSLSLICASQIRKLLSPGTTTVSLMPAQGLPPILQVTVIWDTLTLVVLSVCHL